MNSKTTISLSMLLAVAVSGCYTTTLRSGRPADPKPAVVLEGAQVQQFDDKWHHGFVNGVVEADGNYNLDRICPNGWAEIKTEEKFLNVLVSAATGLVYTPQSVTVHCAARTAGTKPSEGSL